MRCVRHTCFGVLVGLALLGAPVTASAGWPLADVGASTLLGFGANYANGAGSTAVHRGIDIAGAAGAGVMAPLSGTVTFVGRVPGAGGTTVLAVTVRTADGSVTLLPLERASVARGDALSLGDPIGTLAETGDASCSATHLHVGLRSGDLYLDPASVIVPPPVVSPEPQPTESHAGAVAGDVSAEVPSAAGVVGSAQVSAGGVVGATLAPGVSVAGADAPAATPVRPDSPVSASVAPRGVVVGAQASGAGQLAPGVTLAADSAAPAGGFQAAGVLADTGQALSAGGKLARAASSAVSDGRLGDVLSRGVRAAGRGARTAALLAAGVLAAVGALWPLWRAGGLEGPGKVPVSAMREDVAAVASR